MTRILGIHFIAAVLSSGIATSALAPAQAAEPLERRWLYLQTNLQVEQNVDKAEGLLKRAASAGYNGVVLADYKLNILDRVPDHYFRNARRFRAIADELKLEIIPCVGAFGYSDGILAHDPNLAEGLPVRDAVLTAGPDGAVRLADAAEPMLPGGGFESGRGDAAAGWSFQDGPGQASFLDREVKHGGEASLRFENLEKTAAPSGNGRVSRTIKTAPWRQHHASVWIKTEDFQADEVRMFAMGSDGHVLSYSNLGVKPTQDWTQHHIVFNSLENAEIRFYAGAWGGRAGKLWLDDIQLRETAFVNLVRRDGCPLTVRTADGRTLKEDKDYDRLVDPKMGNAKWAGTYDVYHEPPVLKLRSEAKIADGQTLQVSYYHTALVHDEQVACCMAHPDVFRIVEDQARRIQALFQPRTYFLAHDEIRVANWCESCRKPGRSAGQLLAENVKRCREIVRGVNPEAKICVWSDMFDPHHNARKGRYYLVNGDLTGSWEGLDPETLIINWNSGDPKRSLPFFEMRGHGQVLAGFYDSNPRAIRSWLDAAPEAKGVKGAMYTTWRNDFSKLEPFAEAAWGKK